MLRTIILTLWLMLGLASIGFGQSRGDREKVCGGSCGGDCGPCPDTTNNNGERRESAYSQRVRAENQLIDEANALNEQGWAADRNGDYASALAFFQKAESIHSFKGYRRGIAFANMQLEWVKGREAEGRGDYEAELAHFRNSLAFYPTDQGRKNIAIAEQNIANAQKRLQQQQAAALEKQKAADEVQASVRGYIGSLGSQATPSPNGLDFGDQAVVDVRNAASGLPKSVDDAVTAGYSGAPAGVSDRVRKGFQAIATHDWKVAKAWFAEALDRDPTNAGLRRLVELADYTQKRVQDGTKSTDYADESPHPSQLRLPEDSDIQFLFPDWRDSLYQRASTADGKPVELPKDSDQYFLFPGLPAIEARKMNDYIFDLALKDAANDPVLKKLGGRPDQK